MSDVRGPGAIRTVAAIGAGVIGAGWVAALLGAGRAVRLHDPAPDAEARTREHIAHAWPQMAALGLADGVDADWPERFTVHTSLEAALDGADFVQESTPERIELKQALFAAIDAALPADVVVASSTSSFAITDLVQDCAQPQRFVLGHPFNPVHLMPLVEVGGGEKTCAAAIEATTALYTAMGKVPILLKREVFGHIANRLTSAMFREAVRLVIEGYASVADIDKAIRHGPALKWAIQGQFTTFHTSGGAGGLAEFLPKFAPGIQRRLATMRDPDLTDPAVQAELVRQMECAAGGKSVSEIAVDQDAALLALLKTLQT